MSINPAMSLRIVKANYTNSQHASALRVLLNEYAKDPMGGGAALPDVVLNSLAAQLANIPHAFTVLAFVDEQPAGLINGFEGFSTFKAKPLLNLHDITVLPQFRGQGISRKMFERVEQIARERGCCKITLEVLEGNHLAKQAYTNFGFNGYALDPTLGTALYLEKPLN